MWGVTSSGVVSTAGSSDEDVRVLHVDDDETFLELCRRFLEAEPELAVETTTDPAAALERLDGFDAVVSDFDMPDVDGLELLEAVRERDPELPFVLFTGKGSEEIASEAISAGVTDYLQKGRDPERFRVLGNRVRNAVERQRAEERAERKDRQIRRIYERITDAFVAIDDDWTYSYVNRRAAELLEQDAADLLGQTVWTTLPGTRDTRFESELRRAFDEQVAVTLEEYYEPLETWFEIRVFPSESGLSIYFRDVTERLERERRYEAVFNNTYQFTALLDPDGTVGEINDSALEFVDADRQALVGQPMWETPLFQYNEQTREIARESVRRAREGAFYRDELPLEGAAGETIVIDYSVRPVTDPTGEVSMLVLEGRDITDRKEREAQLREERAFTDSLIEALPDVFYTVDTEGRLLRWNEELTDVTGYTDDELAESTPLELVPESDRDRLAAAIEDVLEDDETVTVESALVTNDGEAIPYEFTGARVSTERGEPLALVGVGRDVSDRKRRERQVRRTNEQLEQFASVVSHELQGPLSVARGNVELAAESSDPERLEDALDALDRMGRLIDELLELSREGRIVDDPEPVEVETLLRTAARTAGVPVVLEVPDGAVVVADRPRLRRLVTNLVMNAAEHGSAGRDSAAGQDDEDGTGEVRVGLEGDTLYVGDDGPGVPESARERIFEPGYSSSQSTGFGLAIVTAIAEAHGWSVDVTDSATGGARFEISGLDVRSGG